MNYKKFKQQLVERDGLRCAVTGEVVENSDMLDIEHLTPRADGGEDNIENMILVKPEINRAIGRNTNYRTNLLLKQLRSREEELATREKETYDREHQYRLELERKTSELNEYRHRLNQEQAEQERIISEEIEARKSILKRDEVQFKKRISSYEKELSAERNSFQLIIEEKNLEFKKQEEKLKEEFLKLEGKEKKYAEETRENLKKNSSEYVNEALTDLKHKEDKFHFISRIWSVLGGVSIATGIATLMWFGAEGMDLLKQDTNYGWSYLLLVTFKGLILVGLFIALAKYSFMYSQSYMHESIKNSERRHAINFGKFYMESYGATASWHQIKDAFEHWNIECDSAFSKQDSTKFDPKTIESAVSIMQALGKISAINKQEENKQVA